MHHAMLAHVLWKHEGPAQLAPTASYPAGLLPQAFDRLDVQCKRMAFALARTNPEERQAQGIGELGEGACMPCHAMARQSPAMPCHAPSLQSNPAALPPYCSVGPAATYCADALVDSGWARSSGARGSPGPGGDTGGSLRGW